MGLKDLVLTLQTQGKSDEKNILKKKKIEKNEK